MGPLEGHLGVAGHLPGADLALHGGTQHPLRGEIEEEPRLFRRPRGEGAFGQGHAASMTHRRTIGA